jgi:hypothetical protein
MKICYNKIYLLGLNSRQDLENFQEIVSRNEDLIFRNKLSLKGKAFSFIIITV